MLDPVHHDGSALYVSDGAPSLGDTVQVRLRVPQGLVLDEVRLRTVEDGEPRKHPARVTHSDGVDTWYEAELPVRNPLARYRWYVRGPQLGWGYLTAAGWFTHDVPDAFDFSLAAAPAVPEWAASAVVYQVFPDRFAASGRSYPLPEWVVPRAWHLRPEGRSRNTGREYFGGDLWGAIDRLDHLVDLGVNLLYLTPIFPAHSTHRYDASTFDRVDPLLGGDEALIALVEAAHARGIRVMGDLTLNHSGATHEWFRAAMAGDLEYRGFYLFDDRLPSGYECWMGFDSLPKFDYGSRELRERLITGHDSVLRRWLRPPYNLDGWRIDVANMTGRNADEDRNQEVAALTRAAVTAEGDDKLLIAEHCHDAGDDLHGRGWHGTMNYAAFRGQVTGWLADPAQTAVTVDPHDGGSMVRSLRMVSARMPWRSLAASWTLLGSHDTARSRTVFGTRERQAAALTLLMTLPGSPMVFAGDELGITGAWGEDARVTMPWAGEHPVDETTQAQYRRLIALRTGSPALIDGGLRWLAAEPDWVAYLRESVDERLLIVVARAAARVRLDLPGQPDATPVELLGVHGTAAAGCLHVDADGPASGIWRLA